MYNGHIVVLHYLLITVVHGMRVDKVPQLLQSDLLITWFEVT